MAVIEAFTAFDQQEINLNGQRAEPDRIAFQDGLGLSIPAFSSDLRLPVVTGLPSGYVSYGGTADSIYTATFASDTHRTSLMGDSLTLDGNDALSGGQVTMIDSQARAFGDPSLAYEETWRMYDFAVPAEDFTPVMATRSAADDRELLASSVLSGADVFMLSRYDDRARGYDGDDLMVGAGGNDSLFGGAGNDRLEGDAGDDLLKGGAGDDLLDGGGGNDVMDGGKGLDSASFWSFNSGITVDLRDSGAQNTGGGTVTLVSIENVYGGSAGDTITGSVRKNLLYGQLGDDRLRGFDGSDTLDGGDGNDTLIGNSGNDTLHGGSGDDILDGGQGADAASFSGAEAALSGGVSVDLRISGVQDTGQGLDTLISIRDLFGSSYSDRLIGDDHGNTIKGDTGNDVIRGKGGNDSLHGEDGSDSLYGGGGNDSIYGGQFGDLIEGGNGDDVLGGGAGSDRLHGGKGNDVMTGGGPNEIDTFVFLLGDGADKITDFISHLDVLELDAALWGGATLTAAEVVQAYAQQDMATGNVLLDFGGGDSIELRGLATATDLVGDILII